MRALDTNVIVRLIARDDQLQLKMAEALLGQPFLVLPSVLLETVWVLRSRYNLAREQIAEGLLKILGIETCHTVSAEAVLSAMDRFAKGADFADVLHVALAAEAEADRFVTFDHSVAGFAGQSPIEVETLR